MAGCVVKRDFLTCSLRLGMKYILFAANTRDSLLGDKHRLTLRRSLHALNVADWRLVVKMPTDLTIGN